MDDKIAEFCTVTGCSDPAKAKFFLESSGGDVAAAVDSFFGGSRFKFDRPSWLGGTPISWCLCVYVLCSFPD